MLKRRGVMQNRLFSLSFLIMLCLSPITHAISIGDLTFSMDSEEQFVAKKVLNNNDSARLYQVSVTGIDRPGGKEIRSRPADGELLFSPSQLTLQAGEGENFKFYYNGIKDDRERYYRVSFREIPSYSQVVRRKVDNVVSMAPVVVVDAILVVRPRQINFKWNIDQRTGAISNTGNTWFKLLIKPGCGTKEEDSEAWYLRPGDVLRRQILRQPGDHYIIYNNKFIKLSDGCQR